MSQGAQGRRGRGKESGYVQEPSEQALSSHTLAELEGTQISLDPVSSWSVTCWPGVPTVQVAKYPPLA